MTFQSSKSLPSVQNQSPTKDFGPREEVAEEGVWIRGASDKYMEFFLH